MGSGLKSLFDEMRRVSLYRSALLQKQINKGEVFSSDNVVGLRTGGEASLLLLCKPVWQSCGQEF